MIDTQNKQFLSVVCTTDHCN